MCVYGSGRVTLEVLEHGYHLEHATKRNGLVNNSASMKMRHTWCRRSHLRQFRCLPRLYAVTKLYYGAAIMSYQVARA